MSAQSIWLITIAAIAVVLVVVSVLINVLLDGQGELHPGDTPEGAVQRYLRAIADDEVETAYSYLSADLPNSCTLQHFIQSTDYQRSQSFSARLLDTIDADGHTVVSVEITELDESGPFGGGGYDLRMTFTLVEEEGEWRLAEPPWPMAWCPPERETPTPVPTPSTAGLIRNREALSEGKV
jgi:hypothetical protein